MKKILTMLMAAYICAPAMIQAAETVQEYGDSATKVAQRIMNVKLATDGTEVQDNWYGWPKNNEQEQTGYSLAEGNIRDRVISVTASMPINNTENKVNISEVIEDIINIIGDNPIYGGGKPAQDHSTRLVGQPYQRDKRPDILPDILKGSDNPMVITDKFFPIARPSGGPGIRSYSTSYSTSF